MIPISSPPPLWIESVKHLNSINTLVFDGNRQAIDHRPDLKTFLNISETGEPMNHQHLSTSFIAAHKTKLSFSVSLSLSVFDIPSRIMRQQNNNNNNSNNKTKQKTWTKPDWKRGRNAELTSEKKLERERRKKIKSRRWWMSCNW